MNIYNFIPKGNTKIPNGLERLLSFHKQNDIHFLSNSVGSHEMDSLVALKSEHGESNTVVICKTSPSSPSKSPLLRI